MKFTISLSSGKYLRSNLRKEPKIVANGFDKGLQRVPASFDKNLPQMAFNRKLSSRGVNINQLEQEEVSAGNQKLLVKN